MESIYLIKNNVFLFWTYLVLKVIDVRQRELYFIGTVQFLRDIGKIVFSVLALFEAIKQKNRIEL